jgi:hypothetical protein
MQVWFPMQGLQENIACLDEPKKISSIKHGVDGDLIYLYCLLRLLYQTLANDSKNHSFSALNSYYSTKNVGFFSNGLLAATISMLCLFLDKNKDCRPEDGCPAS